MKAYFYGPCDISAIYTFIKRKNVYYNNNFFSFRSSNWVQFLNGTIPEHPFVNKDSVFPDKKIFCDNTPRIIVISVLGEPLEGKYVNGKNIIRFGCPHLDATKDYLFNYKDFVEIYGHEVFKTFKKYDYCGEFTINEIVNNFQIILHSFPTTTKICILLGPTFDSGFGEVNLYCATKNMINLYSELNSKISNLCKEMQNVYLINPANYYKKPKHIKEMFYYNSLTILHYPRDTYKRMAKQLCKYFPTTIKYYCFSRTKRKIKRFLKKIRNK